MGRRITMTGRNARYVEHRGMNATPDNDRDIRLEGEEALYEEFAYGQATKPEEEGVKENETVCTLLETLNDPEAPKGFKGYVTIPEIADEVTRRLKELVAGKRNPKQVMMPFRAAMEAGVLNRPNWESFVGEFGKIVKSKSSFSDYTDLEKNREKFGDLNICSYFCINYLR